MRKEQFGSKFGKMKPDGQGLEKTKKKKVCWFTENNVEYIDYKDDKLLKRFLNERCKIIPRRISGTSAKFQRALATAIKRARFLALLPYIGSAGKQLLLES